MSDIKKLNNDEKIKVLKFAVVVNMQGQITDKELLEVINDILYDGQSTLKSRLLHMKSIRTCEHDWTYVTPEEQEYYGASGYKICRNCGETVSDEVFEE